MTAAISETSSPDARRAATGAWAAMVGAVIMARTIDDEALSDQMLKDVRDWVGVRLEA
jgi:TetR/AcrR family transcriptional repressor of nem operon